MTSPMKTLKRMCFHVFRKIDIYDSYFLGLLMLESSICLQRLYEKYIILFTT
jgi:hypothetical protein